MISQYLRDYEDYDTKRNFAADKLWRCIAQAYLMLPIKYDDKLECYTLEYQSFLIGLYRSRIRIFGVNISCENPWVKDLWEAVNGKQRYDYYKRSVQKNFGDFPTT